MPHSPAPWRQDEERTYIVDARGKPVAIVVWPLDDGAIVEANVNLVISAPRLAEYVRRKAASGDFEAAKIVAAIEGKAGGPAA